MADLFVYGSLMFETVWMRVVGEQSAGMPAILDGYQRYAVRDETYPAIITQPGGRVEGRLMLSLRPQQLERLDAFEGTDYRRIDVEVRLGGRLRPAQTYLFLRADQLLQQPWDVEGFARTGIIEFMARYGGFDQAGAA
jgi:gamma-glutamylcyclotransferase (GGCT)/AIG2-like uncharacterized protein YtfP